MFLLCLSLISATAHAKSAASDDICAIRPDLCDEGASSGSVADLTRQARRSVRPARAARAAASTTTAPSRNVASVRAQSLSASRSITCRPSTVAITATNANDPICGSSASSDSASSGRNVASVTTQSASAPDFNSYMQSNSRNPALSRRIDGYQTAFRDTSRPATFVAPDVEGTGVREGAAPTVPSAQARNNN